MPFVKSKEAKKRVLILLFLIFISFLFFTLFCLSLQRKLQEKMQYLLLKKSEIKSAQMARERILALKTGHKEVEPYLEQIETAFPDKDNLMPFITSLENLTAQTGNTETISFTQVIEDDIHPGLKRIEYQAILYGNYDSFVQYLKSYEDFPYFAKILNLNISGAEDLSLGSRTLLKAEVYAK